MQADAQRVTDHRTAGGLALSLLGFVGSASAILAVLVMWALLTAPSQVTVAVAGGPSELATTLVRLVVDAVRQLLEWL